MYHGSSPCSSDKEKEKEEAKRENARMQDSKDGTIDVLSHCFLLQSGAPIHLRVPRHQETAEVLVTALARWCRFLVFDQNPRRVSLLRLPYWLSRNFRSSPGPRWMQKAA